MNYNRPFFFSSQIDVRFREAKQNESAEIGKSKTPMILIPVF